MVLAPVQRTGTVQSIWFEEEASVCTWDMLRDAGCGGLQLGQEKNKKKEQQRDQHLQSIKSMD